MKLIDKIEFYVDERNSQPHLVVRQDGQQEFAAGIPSGWSEQDVLNFIRSGVAHRCYPIWEVSARRYGSPMLIKPEDWPKPKT